jgi:hypothetical protein
MFGKYLFVVLNRLFSFLLLRHYNLLFTSEGLGGSLISHSLAVYDLPFGFFLSFMSSVGRYTSGSVTKYSKGC